MTDLTMAQFDAMIKPTIQKIEKLAEKAAKAKTRKTVEKCLLEAYALAPKAIMSKDDIDFLFSFYALSAPRKVSIIK